MQTRVLNRADPRASSHAGGSRSRVVARASTATREKPAWTGDSAASALVNMLINSPVYGLMKVMARQVIKNSAVQKGIPWDAHVNGLMSQRAQLEAIQKELTNPDVVYPDYYLKPFHSYDQGNLCWQAATEVDLATYSMSLRTFKDEPLTPQEAFDKLRTAQTDVLKGYLAQHGLGTPQVIVDMGCSSGMSTRWLQSQFPQADITGMDLSTYFLAVAELQERQKPEGAKRIRYVHGLAEACGLPDASVDLVVYNFVIHECPEGVIRDLVQEARRVLRPGGVLMMADNDPKSKTIQNLPPVLFTLMKSTEPHSDSYYSTDLEGIMRNAGLTNVQYQASDHRHRVVLGTA